MPFDVTAAVVRQIIVSNYKILHNFTKEALCKKACFARSKPTTSLPDVSVDLFFGKLNLCHTNSNKNSFDLEFCSFAVSSGFQLHKLAF